MRSLSRFVALTVFTLLLVSAIQAQQTMGALKAVVDAERRFAKASVDTDIRDSFLAFFAEDGIVFNPNPVNARELYSKRPASPSPPPETLDWDPVFANVSQAGDLGFTTGPYVLTDNAKKAPAGSGYFFSVWKKQADGQWKVALDYGIQAPVDSAISHSGSVKSGSQSKYRAKGKVDPEAERQSLLDAERQFSKVSESNSTAEAYARVLDPEARMNRDGAPPYVGSAAINSRLSLKKTQTKWEPIKAEASSSADLGYTYGSYQSHEPGSSTSTENGFFARVWKRDAKGAWKMAMETATAVKPEEK